ncbi:MAG: hypothetical protein HXS48_22555 [Theionarchaea archaeon]|nr:hypothetical protein [Theionarchaea archaeon]
MKESVCNVYLLDEKEQHYCCKKSELPMVLTSLGCRSEYYGDGKNIIMEECQQIFERCTYESITL